MSRTLRWNSNGMTVFDGIDNRLESALYDCLANGKRLGILKDRQVGCSRGVLAVLLQHWVHDKASSILIIRRNENYCCNLDNPSSSLSILLEYIKTVMPESDYRYSKDSMTLENLRNGNLIQFGGPYGDSFCGNRCTAIFFDDFMSFDEKSAMHVIQCARDVSKCLIFALDAECAGASLLEWLVGCDEVVRLKEVK